MYFVTTEFDFDQTFFRLLGAAGDSLDGENSLDCGVVPSIDTAHAQMDTGGFNLLQVSSALWETRGTRPTLG